MFSYKPLTEALWNDLELLFGKNGAYGGCWCMFWRIKRKDFDANVGEGNKKALKELINQNTIPGILCYTDNQPFGWCSVDKRENYPSLERSPVLKRLDNQSVWSIVCLFIHKNFRGQDYSKQIIKFAIDYAGQNGAKVIEAYPNSSENKKIPSVSSYMGFPKIYNRCGFVECARPSKAKIIMRYYI